MFNNNQISEIMQDDSFDKISEDFPSIYQQLD